MQISNQETIRKRPINLTIREDIVNTAKSLEINTSKAAEAGIMSAIQSKQAELWIKENTKAIQAHNLRIERNGVLIKPRWRD